jgi:hypothetical protein
MKITEIKDILIKEYKTGVTCRELSKKYNFNRVTIEKNLRLWGIPANKVKPEINHHYFNIIDTEEKAYLLGFLCADGCIHNNSNKISFCLNEKDIEILFLIKKELKLNHKISNRKIYDRRTQKYYNQVSLQFSSKIMREDLKKLGINEFKSIGLKLPLIKEIFFPYFIRGVFDGDGHIDKKTCSLFYTKIGWCFLEDLLSKQGINLQNYSETYQEVEKKFIGKGRILFLDWIYNNSKIHLTRRYLKYLKVKEEYLEEVSYINKRIKLQISKDNVLKNFYSIKQAAEFINCSPCSISNVLNGNNKTIKGFKILKLKTYYIKKLRNGKFKIECVHVDSSL